MTYFLRFTLSATSLLTKLTSKSKDVALTFLVSVKNSNISILHDKVIETLSTIEIEEREWWCNYENGQYVL